MNKAIIKRHVNEVRNLFINFKVYTYLKDKYREKIVLVTSASIGDLVYLLSVLNNIKEEKCGNYILVCDKRKEYLVKQYNLKIAVEYYNLNTELGHAIFYNFNSSKWFGKLGKRCGIINTIPWVMYGFNDEETISQLVEILSLANGNIALQFPKPSFISTISSIDNYCQIKDKIVLINPYYASEEKCEIYNELKIITDNLISKGFLVYCNVVNEQKAYPGTFPLRCDLDELFKIANEIPYVISVRSGILDYIASTQSKKIVIYPKSLPANWINSYSLTQWKVSNVIEINLHSKDSKKQIRETLNGIKEYTK